LDAPLRVGLVGCGRVAERGYVPAFRVASGVRLAAVVDPVLERCRALAPGVPAHASAADLVAAGGMDALVLATPAEAHLTDAALAAAAGLPVLVEKPPAPDAEGAAALARLDPPPWIGFSRRYDPVLAHARARIGPDERLAIALTVHYPDPWSAHEVGDDALLDLGPHLVDCARWLARSEIQRVRAIEIDENAASLELELERGTAALSCARERRYRQRVEVRTAAGRTLARHTADALVRRGLTRLADARRPPVLVRLLARQLEAFAGAARGGPAPDLATAADGVAVMAAIDAARRSAAAGGEWTAPAAR
jgi:myo-inositol 2-dehydrogenase/D-chiro-inositol 1-dehydrogenase